MFPRGRICASFGTCSVQFKIIYKTIFRYIMTNKISQTTCMKICYDYIMHSFCFVRTREKEKEKR